MPKGIFSERSALPLVCHPDTPAPAVRCIEARATRRSEGRLALSFRLCGTLHRLRLPPITCAGRADGLWQHTCFEAFIAFAGRTNYLEFNFSPSGQWAAYAFSDYRQRDLQADPPGAPNIRINRGKDSLTLEVLLSGDALAMAGGARPLRLGLSAVIEPSTGQLSYWALRHPGGQVLPKPDFHHPHTFVLELPAESLQCPPSSLD